MVLIVVSLLTAVVVSNPGRPVTICRISPTKANLRLLHNAVNQFHIDTGRWPREDEGLVVLVRQPGDVTNWQPGGYLETVGVPEDCWGNDFIYELCPGADQSFVIKSYGADGREGGEGENADLYSADVSRWAAQD